MSPNVQIEKIIRQRQVDEGKSVAYLCRALRWQRQKWYRFLRNGLIDVNDLYSLSVLLNHDFFQYYSRQFTNQSEECDKLATDV